MIVEVTATSHEMYRECNRYADVRQRRPVALAADPRPRDAPGTGRARLWVFPPRASRLIDFLTGHADHMLSGYLRYYPIQTHDPRQRMVPPHPRRAHVQVG